MQKIYLVRHGETAWSLSGQHTGTTDIPLTEKGVEAAKAFKPYFSKFKPALILTSPLTRAQKTAELAGLNAEIDPNLMEWNYGQYEGLTTKEIQLKSPNWNIFQDGCPGGETPTQVAARADQIIARIQKTDGDVVLFAHGHILKVFVARWLTLPPSAGAHFTLDTATLSILSYYRGYTTIERWNAPLL